MICIATFYLRAAHAAVCVMAAVTIAVYQLDAWGTELAGGTLTGPFIRAQEIGGFFYTGSALLSFGIKRAAVVAAICAMALCLPLSLYSSVPYIFHMMSSGFSIVVQPKIYFEPWNMILISFMTASLMTCLLLLRRHDLPPNTFPNP